MNIVPGLFEGSIEKLNSVVKDASAQKVELLVVPETRIGMLADVKQASTDYLPVLQKIAKDNHIAIATTFAVDDKGKYFNQGYIVYKRWRSYCLDTERFI